MFSVSIGNLSQIQDCFILKYQLQQTLILLMFLNSNNFPCNQSGMQHMDLGTVNIGTGNEQ